MSKQFDSLEWLRFAHHDLAAARLLLTDVELPARIACFHAQQAAEKALKASLVHAAIPFRTAEDALEVVDTADQIVVAVAAALAADGPT